MRQIEQASPYTLETISREQIIESKVIPSATLSRYVKFLLDNTSETEQKPGNQNVNDLMSKLGMTQDQTAQPKIQSLGFRKSCTIYTPLQVFALCWVQYCSKEKKERLGTIRVRLENNEPQYLYLNKVDHPAHAIFQRILEFTNRQTPPKSVRTEIT